MRSSTLNRALAISIAAHAAAFAFLGPVRKPVLIKRPAPVAVKLAGSPAPAARTPRAPLSATPRTTAPGAIRDSATAIATLRSAPGVAADIAPPDVIEPRITGIATVGAGFIEGWGGERARPWGRFGTPRPADRAAPGDLRQVRANADQALARLDALERLAAYCAQRRGKNDPVCETALERD